jgi:hypothetical protein
MYESSQKLLLMHPVEHEVRHVKPDMQLPRESLAFAFSHGEAFRAVVVDMDTWGVALIVEGSRKDLVDLLGSGHKGSVGLLFMSGTGPLSDIVVGTGPGGPPVGGGGPRGWPPPVLLSIVQAVARIAAQR